MMMSVDQPHLHAVESRGREDGLLKNLVKTL